MMQGRRDFAFGIDQATRAYSTLAGPKALWIGNHGHAPSTFPAVDTPAMMAAGKTWFDRYLRGLPVDTGPSVRVAREGTARRRRLQQAACHEDGEARPPGTEDDRAGDEARSHGKAHDVGAGGLRPTRCEGDGDSRGRLGTPRGGVDRTDVGRQGDHRLVGGLPTTPGRRTYTIRMIDQATFVPKGSRFSVTVASSSSAQNPANLLYLDLPMVAGARVALGPIDLSIPVLQKAISG